VSGKADGGHSIHAGSCHVYIYVYIHTFFVFALIYIYIAPSCFIGPLLFNRAGSIYVNHDDGARASGRLVVPRHDWRGSASETSPNPVAAVGLFDINYLVKN